MPNDSSEPRDVYARDIRVNCLVSQVWNLRLSRANQTPSEAVEDISTATVPSGAPPGVPSELRQ
jgi:hypothetical protein